MTDYRCPTCGGGFPDLEDDACPWCGEAMDGSVEPAGPEDAIGGLFDADGDEDDVDGSGLLSGGGMWT